MGMYMSIVTVSDSNAGRISIEQSLLWQLLDPRATAHYEDARDYERRRFGIPEDRRGLMSRIIRPEPEPLSLTAGEGIRGYLDKAWHGLRVRIGSASPRLHTPATVRAVKTSLDALSDDDLRRRFDPKLMMRQRVYPEIWDRDPADDDTLGYLMHYMSIVRFVVYEAARNGHGLVVIR